MAKKAFILNDYTVDLIGNEGVLFCGPEAQAIEPAILEYLNKFIEAGDYIAVCLDTHIEGDPFHPETALFPAHNIKDSKGNSLYGKVGEKVSDIISKYPEQIVIIEKNRYSAFAGTKLDLWLRERGIDDLTISGVCTDMCVLHTAIDAYSRAYKLTVPRAVCYTPNEKGKEFAFSHFSGAMGVNVI